MKKKTTSLEETAYHEAGHAVVCHYLRVGYRYVTINSKDDSLGHLLHKKLAKSFRPDIDSQSSRARFYVEKLIMASLGGISSESIVTGRNNWKGAHEDLHSSSILALYFASNENEAEAFLNWLKIRTLNLLKRPAQWIAVESVAKELLKKRKLSSKEVRELIYSSIQKAVRNHKKQQA